MLRIWFVNMVIGVNIVIGISPRTDLIHDTLHLIIGGIKMEYNVAIQKSTPLRIPIKVEIKKFKPTWLNRLLEKFVSKIIIEPFRIEDSYITTVLNTTNIEEAVCRAIESFYLHPIEDIDRILVGFDEFHSLNDRLYDHSFSFFREYAFKRYDVLQYHGVCVQFVPWIQGIIIVPKIRKESHIEDRSR